MVNLFLPIFLGVMMLVGSSVLAQNAGANDQYQLPIRKATGPIKVDGMLDERDWQATRPARDFWQYFPDDSVRAKGKTEVRITYDDQFLYVGVVSWQAQDYVVQSLRRDFLADSVTDFVQVNLDTFRDKQNAFHFAVNALGVQREGLVANGDAVTLAWDNRWLSQVTNLPDRWTAEMAIPFKTLRYRTHAQAWGLNIVRYNPSNGEYSCWAPIPRTFKSNDLAFSGTLNWDRQPPEPGTNVALIPYVLGDLKQDYVREQPRTFGRNIGFDAKIGLSPSLNLDLTVNPDFAQVEVDQQLTNLTRFELFLPERRQFFLENADLFGTFGFDKLNPFFSRRIGLVRSPVSGELEKTAIHGGIRLSGKLSDRWRVGLLNLQTAEDANLELRTANYTVAAAQYRVFTRSTIGAIVVNKLDRAGYNSVVGLDYNLASANGRWQGKFFGHQLLQNEKRTGQLATGARLKYNSRRFTAQTLNETIGQHYTPDVGFVPRRGILRTSNKFSYNYFPQGRLKKWVNTLSIGPETDVVHGFKEKRLLDIEAGLYGRIKFQNTAEVKFTLIRWEYVYLFSAFDPSGRDDSTRAAPVGTEFRFRQSRINFHSDSRQPFYVTAESRFGQYYNGRLFNLHTILHYRYQPLAQFALDVNYNRVRLADNNDADLLLIGPRVDLTFNRNVYLTALVQYNNQIKNMNVNARLQWRFRPVSDFYLVYTDNYFTQGTLSETRYFDPFQSKNRALVAKLTYWLSM